MSLKNVYDADFKRNLQKLIDLGEFNKSSLGLGQVDNTSDTNKPISTQTQNALNVKLNSSLLGTSNGIAQLDSNSRLNSSQIPNLTLSSNISDVLISNPQSNQILQYNGSSWINAVNSSGGVNTSNIQLGVSGQDTTIAGASAATGQTGNNIYIQSSSGTPPGGIYLQTQHLELPEQHVFSYGVSDSGISSINATIPIPNDFPSTNTYAIFYARYFANPSSPTVPTSATLGGQAMTRIISQASGGSMWIGVWVLANPTAKGRSVALTTGSHGTTGVNVYGILSVFKDTSNVILFNPLGTEPSPISVTSLDGNETLMGISLNTTNALGTPGSNQYTLGGNQYLKYAKSSTETVSMTHANQVRHYVLILKRSQPLATITRSYQVYNSYGIKSDMMNMETKVLQNNQAIVLTSRSAPFQYINNASQADTAIIFPNASLLPLGTTFEFISYTPQLVKFANAYTTSLNTGQSFSYVKYCLIDNTTITGSWLQTIKI